MLVILPLQYLQQNRWKFLQLLLILKNYRASEYIAGGAHPVKDLNLGKALSWN